MEDIIIKNARWLVTMDPERRIFEDGSVVISKGRFVDAGKSKDINDNYEASEVFDAQNMLVMPGIIDAHVHNGNWLAKGALTEVTEKCSLFERIFPLETNMTEEDSYWSSKACQLELIKKGVTTFIDAGNYYPEMMAKAVQESGMRGLISRSSADVHKFGFGSLPENYVGRETMEQALTRGEDLFSKYHHAAEDRIRVWFSLRFLQGVSDQLMIETRKLAEKYETGFTTHAAHTREGVDATMEKYHLRDVERLHAAGVLCPRLLCVHMGWLNMKEVMLLKEHDVNIAFVPAGNIHSAYGTFMIGKFPEMIQLGLCVALGSDSGIGGRFVEPFRNMYLAASIYKETRLDPTIIRKEDVIEMATTKAAHAALWDDEIGTIEPGKKADLTFVDTSDPVWAPVHDPVTTLVYATNGNMVDSVMVDGKFIMKGREILTFDESEVKRQVQKASDDLLKRSNLDGVLRPRWPVIGSDQ
jgi:5-methylthioadenosine/S-adenosylhomocysteine deaminase